MSNKLVDLFTGAVTPGVYRLGSRARATAIADQAANYGWRCFHLDGRQIVSKADFLRVCAGVMQFPRYFGANWDAQEDSLRDLAWAPAQRGYLVLYDHVERFALAQPEEFATALDVLRSAVESWRTTATPMIVLLRGMGRAAVGAPKLS
jgi:hypothetical protein